MAKTKMKLLLALCLFAVFMNDAKSKIAAEKSDQKVVEEIYIPPPTLGNCEKMAEPCWNDQDCCEELICNPISSTCKTAKIKVLNL